MSQTRGNEAAIACRVVRRRLPALTAIAREARVVPIRSALSPAERAATERHLANCEGCATEYRVLALNRAVLDAAAAAPVVPDEDFFKAVRARLNRSVPAIERADESWATLLLVTARQ